MGDFEERLKEQESSQEGTGAIESAPEPGDFEIEKVKASGLKKIVVSTGIIFAFLVIVMVVITSGVFGSDKISEKQLIVGAALTMEENKSLKIEIGEEEHEIEVQIVGEDWVEIVVRSNPMKFRLNVNEVIELDLNNDGTSDIRIKLFKIQEGNAVIAVKRIDKQACVEDWVCEDWGGCANGKRIKECFDVNDCGSEFFIPLHEQKCVGNNPVEVNESLKEVKGMDDVIRVKEVDFSDNVDIKSNMQNNETQVNETELNEEDNNDSVNNISLERVNDTDDELNNQNTSVMNDTLSKNESNITIEFVNSGNS